MSAHVDGGHSGRKWWRNIDLTIVIYGTLNKIAGVLGILGYLSIIRAITPAFTFRPLQFIPFPHTSFFFLFLFLYCANNTDRKRATAFARGKFTRAYTFTFTLSYSNSTIACVCFFPKIWGRNTFRKGRFPYFVSCPPLHWFYVMAWLRLCVNGCFCYACFDIFCTGVLS